MCASTPASVPARRYRTGRTSPKAIGVARSATPGPRPSSSVDVWPGEVRGPLLHVGCQAFARVGEGEAEELIGQGGVEDRRLGAVPVVEGLLGPADCHLGSGAQAGGDLEGAVVDLLVVDAE